MPPMDWSCPLLVVERRARQGLGGGPHEQGLRGSDSWLEAPRASPAR
ncbi:Hypothetical protein A7982_01757 [Minicystis rosea]|nr:Hypothetical protein A7982_01757 [Minicystis rosea]